MEYHVTFDQLPFTMEEFKAHPMAALKQPEHTAALTVAALCLYPKDKDTALAMLDYLRGPRPLSVMEKQFINDRFMDGKDYIPRSYFAGAVPENDYTPAQPYTIRMQDSHAPIVEEGYKILDLFSGGADHPRTVTLRLKPSAGQWFLWDQMLLAGIREPKSRDVWA